MKATYINRATNETYILNGVDGLHHAWKLAEFVCHRMNWSVKMFHNDVTIKLKFV